MREPGQFTVNFFRLNVAMQDLTPDAYYLNSSPVDFVELYCEDAEGNQSHQKWGKDLTAGMSGCLNLKEFGKVPEGNEVCLKIKIVGGDKESCRKSQKLFYKESGGSYDFFRTDETMFNNNRCKKKTAPTTMGIGVSSDNCQYDQMDK